MKLRRRHNIPCSQAAVDRSNRWRA